MPHSTNVDVYSMKTLMARFAEAGLDANALRTEALLRKDEWKSLDSAIIDIARPRLVGIKDLQEAGLVRDLGGLGVLVDEWQDQSDMEEANVSMSGVTEGENDSVEFNTQGVPIPIIDRSFYVNIRRLLASRRNNTPIDTVQAEVAARKVSDKLEEILFNGVTVKADGYSVYGYTTFPYNVDVTIAGSWSTTSTNIISDVELMLAAADTNKFWGPFVLYVPTAFWSTLRSDYSSYKNGTFLDRILDYAEINKVQHASTLATNNILLVQLTRDVVDLAVGQDIKNVEWTTLGGMVQHNKVLAAMAPRLKKTADGTSGIFHGSP